MNPKHALTKTTRSSPETRIEAVLRDLSQSEKPGEIVNALPPHDLLMAYRLADDQQRVDLLAVAEKDQVDLLLDLSCWPGDKPDINALEETLKPLTLSGLGGATRTLSVLEPGLLTLALKRKVIVHLLENRNDEIPAAEASEVIPFPDGLYYLEIPDPDAVTDSQRAMFQAMMAGPFESYQRELECIRHDLVSDLEETAYKWRNARLADFGFTPREQAIAILTPRSAEEVRQMAQIEHSPYPLNTDLSLPVLYRHNLEGNDFLDGVFGLLNDLSNKDVSSAIGNVEVELTAATGTFLTAIGTDLGDIKAVAHGTNQVRNLLALGLSQTSEGNLEQGADLLLTLQPTLFIQVGLSLTYPLQKRARSILKNKRLSTGDRIGSVFDPPHQHTLMSLAKDVPCLWTPILKESNLEYDLIEPLNEELQPISSERELSLVEHILCEVEQLESLLFEALKLKEPLPAETPASVLLMTALLLSR